MKFIKKFDTQQQFNNFVLDENNTPNTSLIEEFVGTSISALSFTPQIIPHNYANDYFTLVTIDDCNFTFLTDCVEEGDGLSYSLDNGVTWSEYLTSTESSISVSAGNKILFKGHNFDVSYNASCNMAPVFWCSNYGRFNVEGNVMSLIYGDNFINQTEFSNENQYMLGCLLRTNEGLINAGNLILPVTTLTDSCYYNMFQGCTGLITAPQLPATQLAAYCYYQMFYGCSSLTAAPDLLATTLESNCYVEMFYDCNNLEYVKCLGNYYDGYSTNNWLYDVAETGTFVKDQYTDWDTGDSGIPEGWTVQNA